MSLFEGLFMLHTAVETPSRSLRRIQILVLCWWRRWYWCDSWSPQNFWFGRSLLWSCREGALSAMSKWCASPLTSFASTSGTSSEWLDLNNHRLELLEYVSVRSCHTLSHACHPQALVVLVLQAIFASLLWFLCRIRLDTCCILLWQCRGDFLLVICHII